MPRSPQERWRERPRYRARHLTPGHPDGVVHAIAGHGPCRCRRAQFVQENRAARVSICAARSNRRSVPVSSAGIGSRTIRVVLQNTATIHAPIVTRHHRADHAGAVLGVVHALRCAPTRPMAGPSGMDDACARHCSATTRWWSDLMRAHYAHNVVDDDRTRAYVEVIPSVPHGTPPDRPYWRPERAFRQRPSGTVRSAHAHDIATRCRTVESGDLHTVGCDPHDLLRRCVSGPHAATRPRSTGRVIASRFSERSKTVA